MIETNEIVKKDRIVFFSISKSYLSFVQKLASDCDIENDLVLIHAALLILYPINF